MKWLKRHLTEIFCVLFLTVIVGVVTIRNYTPGTFLTGIDNFHVEFDLGLALSRAWSGAWQDNQGVGIVSGLAQMTELPRVAIYQVLSSVMPMNWIRYAYIFGNLYLGVMGVFFLTWYLSKSRLAGLAGALFYLFNLGTLQVFFMPTDMFVVNYAALPWLFLLTFKHLSEGTRASLFWYVGLLFLFAPMAMTPTIFVVYTLFIGIITLGYLLNRERWGVKWKNGLAIVGVTMGMSMYFLLPFANFAFNNADLLTQSKINSVFSQENYLMNAGRSSWNDLMTLKGMWFDYPDNVNGQLVPLLGVWNQYLVSVGVWIYLPILFIGIGGVVILLRRRWQGIAIVVIGVVSLFLLRGENPPVGGLIIWMRSLPLVAEAFRTPYTKIAPILTLVYAIFFGYGIYALGQIWRFKIGKSLWKGLIVGGVVAGLIWLNLPYFQAKLISDGVRVKIPNEYFQMFKFFKTQDKFGRLVRLPAYSSQAWDYTNWGYRGSGFLWYGIEQPILDRAFDVWSPYNEGFYNEISTALYGEKISDVAKVLKKYDVRYVLLDESVIAPGQGKEILRIEETKKLAEELGWERKFQEGFLSVWDTVSSPVIRSSSNPESSFISAPSEYSFVEADMSKVRKDVVFDQVGTYVSNAKESVITYPFANLMREEVKNIEYIDKGIILVADTVGGEIVIPGWKIGDIVRIQYKDGVTVPAYFVNGQPGPIFLGKEKPETGKDIIYAKVSEGKEWSEYLKDQRFELQDSNLKIEVPTLPRIYDFGTLGQGKLGNCDVLKRGVAEKLGTSYIADLRGAACDYIEMIEIDPRMSYLIRFQGNNIEGRSLKYFLYNTGSMRNDMEYLLGKNKYDQTFSLLSWQRDGYYTLNIETRSFGQRAENLVNPIEVRWFPLEQIAGAKITPTRSDLIGFENSVQPTRSDLRVTEVTKTGTWLYRVKVEGSGLLKLSQGYDDGWLAPGLTHIKVDGWANGWIIPESGEATIFYWPQLLEYLGFVILGTTIVLVLFRKK